MFARVENDRAKKEAYKPDKVIKVRVIIRESFNVDKEDWEVVVWLIKRLRPNLDAKVVDLKAWSLDVQVKRLVQGEAFSYLSFTNVKEETYFSLEATDEVQGVQVGLESVLLFYVVN